MTEKEQEIFIEQLLSELRLFIKLYENSWKDNPNHAAAITAPAKALIAKAEGRHE